MSKKSSIRVGCGAGFSDDRIDPAQEMAEKGRQVVEEVKKQVSGEEK